MDPIIDSLLVDQPAFDASQEDLRQSSLDQDAFLKIFLTQLENQDPLNPQDPAEMSAQLAQFSQLEQSIRIKQELENISEKIGGSELDPVAMIGRTVELDGNFLNVGGAGTDQSLVIEIDQPIQSLVITAEDTLGGDVGFVNLPISEDGRILTLPPGTYELSFVDGQPQLRLPDGSVQALAFSELRTDGEGNLVPGGTLPFPPQFGVQYQFDVVAAASAEDRFDPVLRTTANVTGVHLVDGRALISVDGTDVDPLDVIRIR